ncbi:MAG: UDP-glucose 4-epimerase GalE [Micrococcales bacterium]|nr:UDP-glucose 4-epimerase GalE [Micrococcales bacterium]MCL2668514.1 UDP-glucose 4-epimerase GalE [Micrococcales bacterium]
MAVLVTGGAGYIGAHLVRLLTQAGSEVVVVDDLSTGTVGRVGDVPLVRLDLADPAAIPDLVTTLRTYEVDEVFHFAARKNVPESFRRPTWYARQNVGGLTNLLDAMHEARVTRIVFSSTAAVYGAPRGAQVHEADPTEPVNPYGWTKLTGEWLVRDAAAAWGLCGVALRYFNVAGAGWPDLGDLQVANLVTMVLDRITRGEPPAVFGTDYPTPDGTCVRDFIHVMDLVHAHVAALPALDVNPWTVFNVGTGTGASVLEVVRGLQRVVGASDEVAWAGRRAGDQAAVVADPTQINESLGWRARHTLDDILTDAWGAWCHTRPLAKVATDH